MPPVPVLAVITQLLNNDLRVEYIDLSSLNPQIPPPAILSKTYLSSTLEFELLNPPEDGVHVTNAYTGATIDQVYTLSDYYVNFIFLNGDTLQATNSEQFYDGLEVATGKMDYEGIRTPNPIPSTP